jgi:hypothetical protein
MEENPYKAPGAPTAAPPARKRRTPWLLIGVLGGVAVAAVLLWMASDSTGRTHATVIVVCPLLGLAVGFLIEFCRRWRDAA